MIKLYNSIRNHIKNIPNAIFNYIFKTQLHKLNIQINESKLLNKIAKEKIDIINSVLQNIDISVDVHEYDHRYNPNWAVISIQGKSTDYIKFIEMSSKDIFEIEKFLRQYERVNNIKIDAKPSISQYLKMKRNTF